MIAAKAADPDDRDIGKEDGPVITLDRLANNLDITNARMKRLEGLQIANEKHFKRIDLKLAEHDTRFDRIDQKLISHDERFNRLEYRLDHHDKRFDQVDERLENLESGFGRIEGSVNEMREMLVDVLKELHHDKYGSGPK